VRSSSGAGGPVTVGVDVGTTSVKSVAVDADGQVVARARVPHRILVPDAEQLEHDARRAWRQGPRRAFAEVVSQLSAPVAGVAVSAMVPSVTAVDRRGVPLLPGILYGDKRTVMEDASTDGMPDGRGFVRWAAREAPSAAGYWPCQAVATNALCGVPAMDSVTSIVFGDLRDMNGWRPEKLAAIGARPEQMAQVVEMGEGAGTNPETGAVVCGGTIDALCDQLVSVAAEPGDVLAIFGATLVIWVVTDSWLEIPGLVSVPHTVPDRFLVGGPSNAGALFADWARHLLRGVALPGPAKGRNADPADLRVGDPGRVPVWLPYLRGERTPFNDPKLRASLHGLDITQGPAAIERAAFEASGFVIRRMLELSGVPGRRVVTSGGGTRVGPWMAAVADATGLPVDTPAVPEGAALGAAFVARVGAGLEPSMDGSQRWARTGARYEPDPAWAKAADERYRLFEAFGPGADPLA
jgi:xylulokinase